jgi:hypothetical protein
VANGAPDLVELARRRKWEISLASDQDGVAQTIQNLLAQSGFTPESVDVNSTSVTGYRPSGE